MTQRTLRPRPGSGPLGGPLLRLEVTGSTNDRARALAQGGAPGGTVVIAEQQTAGRGRQGRTWSAPQGGALTLSAIVRAPADSLRALPFASALAVCEACEAVVPLQCVIKWPNDVLVRGRKAAGILIESRPQEAWAVVGIGLNVDNEKEAFAPDLRDSATSLRIETGSAVDREHVLDALLERLAARMPGREHPLGDLLADYRGRDALAGRRIGWVSGGVERSGEARGIDERGNLVVFADDGEQVVLEAGEVHLKI